MELFFATPDRFVQLSRSVARGELRRLSRGLYTSNLHSNPSQLVRDHWHEIAGHFFPNAIITDRTRPTALPDERGHVFVVHPRRRPLSLPGLCIVPRPGPLPLEDEIQLPHGLFLSSVPRALVENLLPSRSVKGRPRRTLVDAELREWISLLLRMKGPDALIRYRDRARAIAHDFQLSDDFPRLDSLITGVLTGRPETDDRDEMLERLARSLG